jgi:hypothetical protein
MHTILFIKFEARQLSHCRHKQSTLAEALQYMKLTPTTTSASSAATSSRRKTCFATQLLCSLNNQDKQFILVVNTDQLRPITSKEMTLLTR